MIPYVLLLRAIDIMSDSNQMYFTLVLEHTSAQYMMLAVDNYNRRHFSTLSISPGLYANSNWELKRAVLYAI